MSVADCGWGMLFARNAQEAGDLCLICRRAAEASQHAVLQRPGRLPHHPHRRNRPAARTGVHEGVRRRSRRRSSSNLMDPANPMMSGVVQNQDSYMKGKIAQRWYYDQVEPALRDAFDEFYRKTGRRYDFVERVSLRGRRVHPRRHGLLHGDGPGHRRLPAREEGDQGRLPERLLLPPVPGARQIVDALQGLPGVHASSNGWTIRSRPPATT